ncbi:MAG: penicillin-binding protein activator [Thermodesulfobacteriota bacterium]
MPKKVFQYAVFIIIFFSLCYTGCAPKKKLAPVSPEKIRVSSQSANSAWQSGNYHTAADQYKKLLADPEVEKARRDVFYYRLAASLAELKKFKQAQQVLEDWSRENDKIEDSRQWQELYCRTLLKLQGREALTEYLTTITLKSGYPYSLKKTAGEKLVDHYWDKQQYSRALPILSELFSQAEDKQTKNELQNYTLNKINGLSNQDLFTLAEETQKIRRSDRVPYNLVLWAYWLRKLQKDEKIWPQAYGELHSVAFSGNLPDPAPFKKKFAALKKKYGRISKKIYLALPLSGQYSSVSWKILRGASLAQWELARDNNFISIHTFNTAAKNWTDDLASLNQASIVGGPLTGKNWRRVKKLNLHRENVFFTFLPNIKDEGDSGWKFFTSPRDQVKRLITPCMQRLGMTRFAVLYPKDDYGRKMAREFWEVAREKGAEITGLQSYPPDKPTKWGDAVKSLLAVQDPDDPTITPEPDFDAVFIPDSLSRAKGIIPQFFFYDEERLLILGPMLWSQGTTGTNLENNYFSLALTTGAWWPDNPSNAKSKLSGLLDLTMQGKADLWTALGYDFIRHAIRMPEVVKNFDPRKINDSLLSLPPMQWSMAPITWDKNGVSSQNLYVLRMSGSGLNPAHFSSIEALMHYRKIQNAKRMEKLENSEK